MPERDTQTSSRRGFRRRRFLKTSGAGVVALTAGCLGDDGDDTGDDGSTSDDTGDDETGDDDGTTTEPDIDGPIRIGGLFAMPNDYVGGIAQRTCAQLAIDQINDDGGLLGAEVELIVKDTAIDPSTALDRHRDLVLDEEVDVTTGLFGTEPALAIMDSIAEHEVVHVASAATHQDISRKIHEEYDKYKYFFRTLNNSEHLGVNLAQFAQENFDDMGWNRIGMVVEDIEGIVPIHNKVMEGLPEGVTVAIEREYSTETNDFSPIYDALEGEDVDGMFSLMGHTGVPAAIQYNRQQRPFEFGGLHLLSSDPNFYENTDAVSEYIWTYIGGATPYSENTDKTQPMVQAHREAFDTPPQHAQGYTSYDAVMVWAEAVRQAGTLDADEVVATLEDISWTGTYGHYEFYPPDHQYAHDPKYGKEYTIPPIIQWQETDGEGRQEVIWPEEFATAEYQHPPWV
ncbi:MAG: ABC transporter substrate-binding protein [Halovenus sp.]